VPGQNTDNAEITPKRSPATSNQRFFKVSFVVRCVACVAQAFPQIISRVISVQAIVISIKSSQIDGITSQ